MAAHDDKISTNRRKLFKALSAAPVVLTLRPGEAAASASAYQCLNKPDPLQQIVTNGTQCADGDCFAYLPVPMWVPPVPGPGITLKPCAANHLLAGRAILYTPGGRFITADDKSDVTDYIVFTGASPVDISIRTAVNGSELCYENLVAEAMPGYLLVQSEAIADGNTGGFVDWDLVNAQAFTEIPPGATAQGITATCMVSVHPGATTPFVFLKG